MDQRRVTLFLALTLMVFVINGIMFPPAPAPQKEQLPDNQDVVQEDAAEEALQPNTEEEKQPQGDTVDPPVAEIEPVADVPLQYVTLGSLDENSPFRMLATLTNQGAGVKRLELTSRRYRDLQDRGGYLGHLQLVSDPSGGLKVQAVGEGTPAAEAGIKVGDRLLSGKSKKREATFETPEDLTDLLGELKPGRELSLEVVSDNAAPRELSVALARRPMEVIRPESENVLLREDTVPANQKSPPSFLLTFQQLGSAELEDNQAELPGVELLKSNWEILDQDQQSVSFRQRLPDRGLEIIKRYRVAKNGNQETEDPDYPAYHLTLEIEIRNLGDSSTGLAYRLDGPNGLPLEGWWYAHKVGREWTVGIRDIIARFNGEGDPVQFGPQSVADDEVEPMAGNPLAYIGVDAQYFSSILIPEKPSVDTTWIDQSQAVSLSPDPKARSNDARLLNVTCRLLSKGTTLEPGETLEHSYKLFNGPKRPELLQKYLVADDSRYSLGDLEYYGWFSSVSKTMIGILHFFYGLSGNYGLAIIMLTVLVRLCLFPISRKQAKSMAAMQALKPEMDKLKEKYKNDMQKQSQEMQELYRKHNINPLGGCLPMFIQLPIMMGLYRSLMVDVELRQAPLISESVRWCSNLAAPDMFFDWSSFMPEFVTSGEGFFGLGPYLNILPLVTIVLFILQQKMFMPEATNEQAAMQQKIMQYMMIFMGLMFFKVASGLCIYFITSSIWGIAERKLIPPPTAGNGASPSQESKQSGSSGSRASAEKKAAQRNKAKRKKKR